MVRFRLRWIKKRYQNKREYRYKHYSLHFPSWLNKRIDPHYKKDFEIDFAFHETPKYEEITITLTRDKTSSKMSTSKTRQ